MPDHDQKPKLKIGRALLGIVFIFCGLVYLGVNIGIFDWTLLANLWRLWPLLLVALGLSLLARSRFPRLLIFFLFIVVAIAGLFLLWRQSEFQQLGLNDTQAVDVTFEPDTELVKLDIRLPAATLKLSGPADTNKLLTGRVETRGLENEVTRERNDKREGIHITQAGSSAPFVGVQGLVELQLSSRVPFEIYSHIGKTDATLDFSSLNVERLDLVSGASSVDILFGDIAAHTEATIQVGASSVNLSAPTGVGVRLHVTSGVTSTSIDGLEKIDEHLFESKEFAIAPKQIMIDVQSGVSSIVFTYR